jgi:hypothetical protein
MAWYVPTATEWERLLERVTALEKNPDSTQQRDNWIETARQYAGNSDYWRERAEQAEALAAHTDKMRLEALETIKVQAERAERLEEANAEHLDRWKHAKARVKELASGIETWRRSADGYRVQMEEQIKRRHQDEARVAELEAQVSLLEEERARREKWHHESQLRVAELETKLAKATE